MGVSYGISTDGYATNNIIIDRPKTDQELRFEVLQLKRKVRNNKILSAVIAGASVVGSLVASAFLGVSLPIALLGGTAGLALAGLTYASSVDYRQRLDDLIESMKEQSIESLGKEDSYAK